MGSESAMNQPSKPSVARKPLPKPNEVPLSSEPLQAPPPSFLLRAAMGLRQTLLRLADNLAPPQVRLFEMTFANIQTQLIGSVARLGIADLLAEGPQTAEAMAAKTGVNADALHRTLRTMVGMGVFSLNPDGRFENNRTSEALRQTHLSRARNMAIYFAAESACIAWNHFDHVLETGKSAFQEVTGMHVFDWFNAHPLERENFAHGMMGFTIPLAPLISTLYPLSEVKKVCDVGGGRGLMISEMLVRHPHLKGVLLDAPGVIESAREVLRSRGVADRVELAPGSFFEKIPSGCDMYLIKQSLHNWDDKGAERILRNIRGAMEPGAKCVIAEMLVDRNSTEPLGTLLDMQMLTVTAGGRERSAGEYQRLLEAAGFRPGRVFDSPQIGLVEGVAV